MKGDLTMKLIIGVDISKDDFYVYILDNNKEPVYKKSKIFDNNKTGFSKFTKLIMKCQLAYETDDVHIVIEATGVYSKDLAYYLYEQNFMVSIVNPSKIKLHGESMFRRAKNDNLDAQLIAHYGITFDPPIWEPPSEQQEEIREISRRIRALTDMLVQEKNRLHAAKSTTRTSKIIIRSIKATIKNLEKQIEQLKIEQKKFLEKNSEFKKNVELLDSIKGIGIDSAIALEAELSALPKGLSIKQLTAYVGLCPINETSGKSVNKKSKISKQGVSHIREILYMCTLSAKRFNTLVSPLAQRMMKKGRLKMTVMVACMRKLLHIIYGVLKHQKDFDPNYNNKDKKNQEITNNDVKILNFA